MIIYYRIDDKVLQRQVADNLQSLPPKVLWIDMLQPSQEEERFVEAALGVDIPTREEMTEIEDSSRFYENDGTLYMTPVVVSGIGEQRPEVNDVFFVFNKDRLVTVRYTETSTFRTFPGKIARQPERHRTCDMILASLIDGFVDRIADVLEDLQAQLDGLSRQIFGNAAVQAKQEKADMQQVIKYLGRHNSLLAKLDDSLLSFSRLITYLRQGARDRISEPARNWLKAVERDLRSLGEYQAKMSGQITFLLDATLGLINIEQNSIIKVFSIAAVLFLPPTLVGTVYGMNFKIMPELDWSFGYPLALGMMVFSALLSYVLFKYKDWL
ncbi:magnesium transporter CorA family protein [Azomonas macrocytogenes]|uniref:Magnesium transport protein CorA n=1 Tax=Azomonas macrocytogenes TaxID=69962 RepID=A0A839T8K9_AZOMA|nr:magnesium transporter CorA family protein [Azomonas macrocytogenes]MBB3104335.1 magnesium transporter [Azomonas macrocytogenes]